MIKVIVASHKEYRMPEEPMYLPLQVGAEGKESIGYTRDDTGDNISSKNSTYCELTGMYYAWKNVDADFLGLVHYRRHFAGSSLPFSKDPFDRILTETEATEHLRDFDIIVPSKRHYFIESLYSHYDHTLDGKHLRVAYRIIAKHFPEYIGCCNRVYRRTWGYMFNMMITSRELFAEYCEWLFFILSKMENVMDKTAENSSYTDFEKRLYGRVSEILFNVWIDYKVRKGLTIKELKCIHMESVNWAKKGTAFLEAKFLGKKYEESF